MINFLRLTEQIRDESSTVEFLQQHGIIHAQRFCKKVTLRQGDQDRQICSLKACRQDDGLSTNNWLPLQKVILIIYS